MMGLYWDYIKSKRLQVLTSWGNWKNLGHGPHFKNADLIQQNLTNKGTKLGVGYISTNGQKLTVFLFPLAVAGMCPFWGTWENFCFFQAVIHTNLPTLCRVGWPSFFGWSTPGESMTPEFCGKPKKRREALHVVTTIFFLWTIVLIPSSRGSQNIKLWVPSSLLHTLSAKGCCI